MTVHQSEIQLWYRPRRCLVRSSPRRIGRQGLTRCVLLDAFSSVGAAHPISQLSTGNVSFECAETAVAEIRAAAQRRVAAVVGRNEPIFVR